MASWPTSPFCWLLGQGSAQDIHPNPAKTDHRPPPFLILAARSGLRLRGAPDVPQLFSDPGQKREPFFGKTILVGPPKEKLEKGSHWTTEVLQQGVVPGLEGVRRELREAAQLRQLRQVPAPQNPQRAAEHRWPFAKNRWVSLVNGTNPI